MSTISAVYDPTMVFKYSQLCDFCVSPILDYKKIAEAYKQKYEDLMEEHTNLMKRDSCYSLMQNNPPEDYKYKVALLDEPKEWGTPSDTVKMVTITFDPKKFPTLFDRSSQRDYIIYILNEMVNKNYGPTMIVGDFYGCFELHESGVVHAHILFLSIFIEQINDLKMKFTNNKLNDKCIHVCEKPVKNCNLNECTKRDPKCGRCYVNKYATKDKNENYNYFEFKNPRKKL